MTLDVRVGKAENRGDHRGGIRRLFLNRKGVGGERVFLYPRDETVDTVAQRENQRDTDDTDASGKCGEEGSRLLRHQVRKGERERRQIRHGSVVRLCRRFCLLLLVRKRKAVRSDETVQQADGTRCVGNHDDKFVLGNLFEKLHNLDTRRRVESTGWLVRKDDVGVVYKGAGNRHTLHLSAGELVRLLRKLVAQAYILQRFAGTLPALGLRNA